MIRIAVDFNAMTVDGKRVWINARYLSTDIAEQLQSGIRVLLYEPGMEVEAILEHEIDEKGREWWYGVADWDTQKDTPITDEHGAEDENDG